ncbi:MAG: ABC transporter permease DevC [Opitutales bacterium]
MAKLKKSLFEKVFPLGIPLAWLQLSREKKRFFVAIAGITFAVTMMLFQMGLQSALFRQVVAPILLLDADVMIVSPNYEYFGVGRGFSSMRLNQAYGDNNVESISELKLGGMSFKNPENGKERDIFIIAFDPSKDVFESADIKSQQYLLKKEGTVLFDSLSRDQYGDIPKLLEGSIVDTELNGTRTKIEGTMQIGATFAADGNILMSLNTFNMINAGALSSDINVGIIKLKDKTKLEESLAKLRSIYTEDIIVMSKEEFIKSEKDYWAIRTPIGFVIGASMAVAIFVGAVIVYQILYTDVTDHLPEYATLKAIGFDDKFFITVILQESMILSFLGFIPGAFFAGGLYYLTRTFAHMPTYLTTQSLFIVFSLTLFMCVVAGLFATRKLRSANPSDIF